jgi:protein-S-isoprenylcysteine O-methyltransferase Ste14
MNSRPFYIITAVQIVAATALLWLIFARPGTWDLQRCIGSGLMIMGICGIAAARFQLGRSFAIKAEAHQLVTRGIYSKIRNPIYVFGVIEIAGVALALHQPVLWFFLPLVAVMQIVRARREAHVLEAAFGEAYRAYRRKTWF